MNTLSKFDAAKAALDQARSFDDVLAHKDRAQVQITMARIAKDDELIRWATEIKTRAERKAGEMLLDLEKAQGGRPITSSKVLPVSETAPTLKEIGVSKTDSSRWQVLAKVPEDRFEREIKKGHVSRAAITRAVNPPPGKAKPIPKAPHTEESPSLRKQTDELSRTNMELNKQLETYVGIVEGNDEDMAAEIKKLHETIRVYKQRINSLTEEHANALKQVKYWMKRCEKAENKK